MIEKRWRALAGEEVVLRDAVLAALRDCRNEGLGTMVHIGSDSQQFGKETQYCTVVIVVKEGKGARVFFNRERVPRIRTLRERLYNEVWRSTELAMELTSTPDVGLADELSEADITIHVDANVDPAYKSSEYVQELAGLCVGMGFSQVLLKPDSWAASHAADHVVKHRDERRKPHAERRGGRAV